MTTLPNEYGRVGAYDELGGTSEGPLVGTVGRACGGARVRRELPDLGQFEEEQDRIDAAILRKRSKRPKYVDWEDVKKRYGLR